MIAWRNGPTTMQTWQKFLPGQQRDVEQSLTIRDMLLWAEMARPLYCQLDQSLAGCHPTNSIKTEADPKEDTSWKWSVTILLEAVWCFLRRGSEQLIFTSATVHILCHADLLFHPGLWGNLEEGCQQNKPKLPLMQFVLGLQMTLTISLFLYPFKFPLLSTATSV